jgi:hypothetical protein
MHIGREALLVDDFSSQRGEELALFARESRAKIGFMFGGQFGNSFQHAPAARGQDEFGVAAIFDPAFPLDQSLFRQLID